MPLSMPSKMDTHLRVVSHLYKAHSPYRNGLGRCLECLVDINLSFTPKTTGFEICLLGIIDERIMVSQITSLILALKFDGVFIGLIFFTNVITFFCRNGF